MSLFTPVTYRPFLSCWLDKLKRRKRYGWSACWQFIVALSLGLGGRAQESSVGSITGTVTEIWDGKPLAGVTVTIRGTTLAVTTDAQGRFQLHEVPPGNYTLTFSAPGYARAALDEVLVVPGQTSPVSFSLRPEFYELEEYVVTAPALETQENNLLQERQSASAMIEALGSERFTRLAAGDAAEIMTKITGIAVVEGKFAVIRGLSDRYNMALLNGADIPSADPYRRAAQLDLFPAEVIDRVVVHKTFTPDLPGGFSGGAMDIRTRSFPEQFVFKISAGLGFNTQATGKERFLTYPGGSTDWLGKDDGTRSLPAVLVNISGAELQQLTQTATSGSLAIPLEKKTAAAQQINQLVRSFGTPHMGPRREAPPPDHSFKLQVGDTVHLNSVPLGYFAGVNYERDYRFYEAGVRRRYVPTPGGGMKLYQDYTDSRAIASVQWSALANLASKLNQEHQLGYTFLYTQNAEDQARQLFGRIESSGEDQFNDERRTHLNVLHWTERSLSAHQIRGAHILPGLSDLQTDWLFSLATTTQDEPDLRYFNFISYPDPQNSYTQKRGVDLISNNIPFPDKPTRYFRQLEDVNLNGKLDLTLPLEDARGLVWKPKAGLLVSSSERIFRERTFSYAGGNASIVDTDTFPYEYLLGTNAPPPLLTQTGNRMRYTLFRSLTSVFGNNHYDGAQDIYAAYGMLEIPLHQKLRWIGGIRYESTQMVVDSSAYQSPRTFRGEIVQGDLLPAASLHWQFLDQMSLRLSYAETLARPTYREFARYRSYDVTGDQIVEGNPYLKQSRVQNYDIRWEWFPGQGSLLSLGGFYKSLQDPIEKFNATLDPSGKPLWTASGDFVTFLNTPAATVWGFECEVRQNLGFLDSNLSPFSLGFNFAYLISEVPLATEVQELKYVATGRRVTNRPLYDQAPFIINADLSYDNATTGTQVTLSWYYAAERLALVVNNGYDIYEQPAPSLDFVLSQKLGRKWTLKLTARNLLNPDIQRSYAVSGAEDTHYLYSSYTRGISFDLSLSYQF